MGKGFYMPKIEQLDWGKLKPPTPEIRNSWVDLTKAGTIRKGKTKWKPKAKKIRLDPRVAYEQYTQREHLRNIKHELDN